MRESRRDAARARTDAAAAASTVQRLAVLLEAGISPDRAWQLLAVADDGVAAGSVAADIMAAAAAAAAAGAGTGRRVGAVLAERGGAWRDVGVAWRVAETVGAPLAPSLRRFADALRDAQETRDDVAVALADPAATARLIAWLPLVAVGLGIALGFDLAATFTQPAGLACLVAGMCLMLVARRWTSRLVATAQPDAALPGLQGETVAIALSSGVSIERALAVVADAGGGGPDDATRAALSLSERAGARAVDLLRAEAADARRRSRTEGRLRAARLGSRLLLPMGVCTLPAFLLLGVGPMLLSVLSGAMPALAAP